MIFDFLGWHNGLDNCLRRTSLDIRSTSLLTSQAYGYDSQSGRLQAVTDGVNAATYSYVANSALISQINSTSLSIFLRRIERRYSFPPSCN